jgi:predicted nucleotidyltransferase
MNDTFVPPLQIKHDQIDPTILEVVRKIHDLAGRHNTPYFLAGATAREVILHHVFGRPPGRRTLDVDFGIAVRDWKHFQDLKSALIEQVGFTPVPHKIQRLSYPAEPPVIVDLIPFGGVESPDRTIAWPPDEDIVMTVAGFNEALDSSVLVQLDTGLVIKVVCLPALIILKLLAWTERRHENRDAEDIYTLLKQYGDAGNENRLYGEELALLEADGYDFELAGARLIGIDAARIISPDTRKRIAAILQSEQLVQQLVNQISVRAAAEHLERCEVLVTKFRDALLSTP